MKATVWPNKVTTRAALARSESWTDTTVQLVSPARAGETTRIETVAAKRVEYPPIGHLPLTVVSVRDSGYTFLTRDSGRPFYIAQGDDLLSCLLNAATLVLSRDAGRILTPEGGLPAAISQFVGTLDDTQLSQLNSNERRISVDLIRPGEGEMWYLLEMFSVSIGKGPPTIEAIDVADGVLRLDLESASRRTRYSFWIDLKGGKLLKSAPYRKGTE